MKEIASEKMIGLVIGQLSQGGAERQVTRIAIELKKQSQYVPIVFCLSADTYPYGAELTNAGIRWFAPPDNIKLCLYKLSWLMRMVRQCHCDLLYGFLNVGNIYAGAAATYLRLPFIASIRSANSAFSPIIKELSRFFLMHAKCVVGNSASCIRILREDLHVIHNRVTVIPNIVTPIETSQDARTRLRERWGVTTEPVIGTIALLKKSKRPWLFVDTFASLNLKTPAHFVWVGDGPERESFKAQISSLDSRIRSRIHFEGYQTDVGAYLSAFDIFVMTSAYEGSPNSLLEAMSAGKVSVATCVPGIVDIFANQTLDKPIGILCDTDDAIKISEAIDDILCSTTIMRQISINAQKWIKDEFSSNKIIDSYSKLFSNTLLTGSSGCFEFEDLKR